MDLLDCLIRSVSAGCDNRCLVGWPSAGSLGKGFLVLLVFAASA